MSLPKYPHYKPSGVQWLGDVPAHWGINRIKHVVRSFEQGWSPQCEGFPVESEQEWGVLKVGCVNGGVFRKYENKALPAELEPIPELGIRRGDLLISRANTRELVGSAAVARCDHANLLLCDKLYRARVDAHVCIAEYLGYYLGSDVARGQIELSATGASSSMVNIGQGTILEMRVPMPDVQDQRQIVDFLDHETAKIDALIAEQEKLIHLLAEKRQATISHAVTRGLDPAAPMKDSGVAWLGEVPAHWEVVRVRHAVTIDNSARFPINREERAEMVGQYPYWGPTGIIDHIDQFRYEGSRALIGEDGDHFTKHAIWPMTQWATGQFNVNNHAHVIADGARCTARWFYFSFLHRDIGGDLIAQGVSRLKLTREGLSNLWLVVPPLDEQMEICAHLEAAIDRQSEATQFVRRQISLLQERRAALIAAAVTGQIDVRQNSEILNGGEARDAVAALS